MTSLLDISFTLQFIGIWEFGDAELSLIAEFLPLFKYEIRGGNPILHSSWPSPRETELSAIVTPQKSSEIDENVGKKFTSTRPDSC